jgi:hypothetical protein
MMYPAGNLSGLFFTASLMRFVSTPYISATSASSKTLWPRNSTIRSFKFSNFATALISTHPFSGGVGPSYLLDKALRALEADSCLPMFIGFIEFDVVWGT